MKPRMRLPVIAVLLILACGNFIRLSGNENIRPIQYISLLTIGALLGVFIVLAVERVRQKHGNNFK